jgi:endonuclease YncB( thermonuclease family)
VEKNFKGSPYLDSYEITEKFAKENKKGIWSSSDLLKGRQPAKVEK